MPLATFEARRHEDEQSLLTPSALLEREIDLADAIFLAIGMGRVDLPKECLDQGTSEQSCPTEPESATGSPRDPQERLGIFCLASGPAFSKGTHLLLAAFAPLHQGG